jgi:hypothetical protein
MDSSAQIHVEIINLVFDTWSFFTWACDSSSQIVYNSKGWVALESLGHGL